MHITAVVLLVFIAFSSPLHAGSIAHNGTNLDTRAAPWIKTNVVHVRIRNNTPNPVYAVSVLHKYSNVHKERKLWTAIPPNEYSKDTLKVQYNTGFGTTGVDWWLINWFSHDNKTVYTTAPKNFRWFFDKFAKVTTAVGVDRILGQLIDENDATAGFKRCFLTADDENGYVDIIINSDKSVRIKPEKSSACDTGTESLEISTALFGPPRPFYAIAHRVNSYKSVLDAMNDGVNALEIDVRAWKGAWRATHDRVSDVTGLGPPVSELFEQIAQLKRGLGNKISFVWLDLKNPHDNEKSPLNMETLIQLARAHLEPAGVRVLFGFYDAKDSAQRAYKITREGLNANEAIALEGSAKDVAEAFDKHGPLNRSQRVMTNGLFDPKFKDLSPQIRAAAQSNTNGKVFAWTIGDVNSKEAMDLMVSGADGLICGCVSSVYSSACRSACKIVTDLPLGANGLYLANGTDKPW